MESNTATKFHPILFSTPMVQAIMENRKTQTRRIVKLPKFHPSRTEKQHVVMIIKDWNLYDGNNELIGKLKCPYNVGDVLWVRETFIEQDIHSFPFVYKADFTDSILAKLKNHQKWKPSLFMPKRACRTFLKIKSIRVERLQEISEEDAIAEGIIIDKSNLPFKPISKFFHLWESINGEESLNKNPFVWVYEFEKIEKPLDFGV